MWTVEDPSLKESSTSDSTSASTVTELSMKESVISTSVSVLPTAMSPVSMSVVELSIPTSSPAAIESSPAAITASWSNSCVTSPSAQIVWLTDWSTIVARLSIVKLLTTFWISRIRSCFG